MSAIAALMRSDWGILRFISTRWASVIRDYAPYPSLLHWHVSLPNFNFLHERMGRLWLATRACDPGVSQWIDRKGEEGQIRDAHELGMNSAVHSTLAVPPVSLQSIFLDKRQSRGPKTSFPGYLFTGGTKRQIKLLFLRRHFCLQAWHSNWKDRLREKHRNLWRESPTSRTCTIQSQYNDLDQGIFMC